MLMNVIVMGSAATTVPVRQRRKKYDLPDNKADFLLITLEKTRFYFF